MRLVETKRRVGSTVRVCHPSVAYWLLLDLFDRRQQHPERPTSHLLPIRKIPFPLQAFQRLQRLLQVGFEVRQVLVSGRLDQEWQLLEGASQGPAWLPLLVVPSLASLLAVRQPGYLLQRSAGFAPPSCDGFALLERIRAL
jgi:hypothetical protein